MAAEEQAYPLEPQGAGGAGAGGSGPAGEDAPPGGGLPTELGQMWLPDQGGVPPSVLRELLSPGDSLEELFTRSRLTLEDVNDINLALTVDQYMSEGSLDVEQMLRRKLQMLISLGGESRKEAIQYRSGIYYETRNNGWQSKWLSWRGKAPAKEKE